MRVLVLGATGVLGRQVVPRLLERGHAVRAVVRAAAAAQRLGRLGIEASVGDILDGASLREPARGCEAVLHLATAIPGDRNRGEWSRNDAIRRDGTQVLLAAATEAGVRRYVQQSITMPYGEHGTQLVDESTPFTPTPTQSSAVEMERQVRACALDWCILRGAYLYGPGTGWEDALRTAARADTLRLPADGSALLSLIHAADFGRAIVLACETARGGSIYNVVDDRPATYREVYGYIAAQLDAPEPAPGGPPLMSLACDNARLKADLGWQPAYPSFRSGLAD